MLNACYVVLRSVLVLFQIVSVWVRVLGIWAVFFLFDYKVQKMAPSITLVVNGLQNTAVEWIGTQPNQYTMVHIW